jgi:ribosome-associated protein
VTDSKPSKSARKRVQLALQELGEQLIALNDAEISSLSLTERLDTAVRSAKKIKSHGALRRQKQLIGKIMRDIDPEPIRAHLLRLRADETRKQRIFARAEKWRDRLVSGDSQALQEFFAQTGAEDDELRSLLSELQVAFSERAEKTVRRKIFRRVHEILVRIPQ